MDLARFKNTSSAYALHPQSDVIKRACSQPESQSYVPQVLQVPPPLRMATSELRTQSAITLVGKIRWPSGWDGEGSLWGGWRDLNPRPLEPQSSALPTELHPPLGTPSVYQGVSRAANLRHIYYRSHYQSWFSGGRGLGWFPREALELQTGKPGNQSGPSTRS
jgi:hypothetical protein